MESTNISELKVLADHYALYAILKDRGVLSLAEFFPELEFPALDTIMALLHNLPTSFWRYKKIYLQNLPLPQIGAPLISAPSGLTALELSKETLLIDIGHENMGPAIINWLATFGALMASLRRLAQKSGLATKLSAFNSAMSSDTGRAEQLLVELSFLLGTTLEELVIFNNKSQDRLIPALLELIEKSWKPLVYLHKGLMNSDFSEYTQDLKTVLSSIPLNGTPLHLILTDSPAFSDLLSPYVRELRPILEAWYRQNPNLVKEFPELEAARLSNLFSEDLLYWILRDFLVQKGELMSEYTKAAATCGIVQRGGPFGQLGSYTLIDLSALEYSLADPRLLLKQSSRAINGLLLILPIENGAFFPLLNAILAADNLTFNSISILKRAIPLNGAAIILPMAFINGLNGAIANLPLPNLITGDHLNGLISGQISQGVIASLPGSYLVSPGAKEELSAQRLAIAYDKEGYDLINELLFSLLASHRLSPNWEWRAIYYSTIAPLEEAYLRQGVSDAKALFTNYAAAVALLRSLFNQTPKAPASRQNPPKELKSSNSFRLRV